MASAAIAGETMNTSTRLTREGRKLTYQLNIIQQPERARACGSGAKSHADRRPVDPPPVVQLQIFEGDTRNDITFSHNANFFLYATLEAARPIAQGRLPPAAASIPVLTGVFVSGMAYLDRPTPAGYFIFPDLSVRNEGKYRLSFNLYEEVKDMKDADAEPAKNHPDHANNKHKMVGPMAPKQHVDWRLEVKSKPFTVFSAKKFPGLAESTSLSRIVAEQGCRVRIRRDVRMRRRENKAGKDLEEYDEEAMYQRARETPTPDVYQQTPTVPHQPVEAENRQRSASDGSLDSSAPYGIPRRPSIHEQQAFYPTQPYPQSYPTTPQAAQNGMSHLAFGGSSGHQYSTPTYQPPVPQVSNHQPQNYTQNRVGYHQQSPAHYGYTTERQAPMSHSSQQQTHPARHENGEYRPNEYRHRPSVPYGQPALSQPTSSPNGFPAYADGYSRPQTSYQPQYNVTAPAPVTRAPTPTVPTNSLPPLKSLQPLEPKYEGMSSPAVPTPVSRGPAILSSPSYDTPQARTNSFNQYTSDSWSRQGYSQPTSAPTSAALDTARSSKRAYDAVFGSQHMNQSLHNGMRPGSSQFYGSQDVEPDYDDDCSYDVEKLKMEYKRADGSAIRRQLPSSQD
ncbi:MAG: velvet protein [Geoglossum umbratile]|nr:MAG: velvet protein [Geoglossum umbratile]